MKESSYHPDQKRREVVRLLRGHAITPTAQRIKIATALLARPQHLSAEQVLILTNATGKPVSKATIYNTLRLFTRHGLIQELTVDSGRAFYDSSTHSHAHLYNPETQELTDMPDGQLEISLPDTLPHGTEIDRMEVIVYLRPVNKQ